MSSVDWSRLPAEIRQMIIREVLEGSLPNPAAGRKGLEPFKVLVKKLSVISHSFARSDVFLPLYLVLKELRDIVANTRLVLEKTTATMKSAFENMRKGDAHGYNKMRVGLLHEASRDLVTVLDHICDVRSVIVDHFFPVIEAELKNINTRVGKDASCLTVPPMTTLLPAEIKDGPS